MNFKHLIPTLVICLMSGAANAQSSQVVVGSQVAGLEFTRLGTLPKAPRDDGSREACSPLTTKAATAAGKYVEKRGWAVTGEGPLGQYQAVSFVGKFQGGTSGTCKSLDGNVGIFANDKLVAIIYADKDSILSIGRIVPFESNGLRILDGEFLQMTAADIRTTGQSGIAVTPPALEEKLCDGTATVPFIERLPIEIARDFLAEYGWKPVASSETEETEWSRTREFKKRGIVEVEDCSGTGFGFCRFNYSGEAGKLYVTTAGEYGEGGFMPFVYGYGLDCAETK